MLCIQGKCEPTEFGGYSTTLWYLTWIGWCPVLMTEYVDVDTTYAKFLSPFGYNCSSLPKWLATQRNINRKEKK